MVSFVAMENEGMDLLGRHIQKGGISIARNKVYGFVALRSPTNFAELDKTIGMFAWLMDHLPWAADISAPLHELSTSKDWEWTATHENAFKRMKQIIGGSEVLTPLDLRPGAPPIQVVSDASLSGIGGYLCQGDTLETSKRRAKKISIACSASM